MRWFVLFTHTAFLPGNPAGQLLRAADCSLGGSGLQAARPPTADDHPGPEQDSGRVCPADALRCQRRRRKPKGIHHSRGIYSLLRCLFFNFSLWGILLLTVLLSFINVTQTLNLTFWPHCRNWYLTDDHVWYESHSWGTPHHRLTHTHTHFFQTCAAESRAFQGEQTFGEWRHGDWLCRL